VENFAELPFCSKVVAAYGLEIVSNVLTVVPSPPTWIWLWSVKVEDVVVVVVDRLQHVEFKNTCKTHLRPSWRPGGREKTRVQHAFLRWAVVVDVVVAGT
jgi:hypothetical protein